MMNRWIRRASLLALLAANGSVLAAQAPTFNAQELARGEYVAHAADCAACHTASPSGKPFAGGLAIQSPMGAIIATNITPSKRFGIGDYSLEDFKRAVRQGVTPDGTHLYPAMPYTSYKGISDDDMAALYAYMQQGVTAVNAAPARKTALGFPFNLRAIMVGWNLLYAGKPGWTAPDGLDPQQRRGAYLVNTLAHCSTCHTPRGAMMNEQASQFLAGGKVGGWTAPNITPDPVAGIGGWSMQEIATYLKTGHVEGKASAAGSMAEAIEHSFRYLSDADLAAIAAYMKTVKPIAEPGLKRASYSHDNAAPVVVTDYETGFDPNSASARSDSSTTSGAVLYDSGCASCHGENGQGLKDGYFPSLTRSSTVGSADPSDLVMTIVDGIRRHGANGYVVMPEFGDQMSDAQIASVASYVAQRFGSSATSVNAADVQRLRSGGSTPWLIAHAKVLMVVTFLVLLLIVGLLVRLLRRKSSRIG